MVLTKISSGGGLEDNVIVSPQTGEDVDIPVYKEVPKDIEESAENQLQPRIQSQKFDGQEEQSADLLF